MHKFLRTQVYAWRYMCKHTCMQAVSTYGFRGEALSSLCALSNLSVVTRTEGQAAGTRIEYDKNVSLVAREPVRETLGCMPHEGQIVCTHAV